MFWRFGGYANISTIDSILEKESFQLEELLDEGDLIQELKQHNAKLVEYLRNPPVLSKLLQYVVAPKLEPVATADDEEGEDDNEKGKGVALAFNSSQGSSRAGETSQEDSEKKRNRYAFVAAEILSSDTWSIYEALMEERALLRDFWQFLKRPPPLDPLQASYFTKVNESLFDKKTEEMLDLLKSMDGAISDILRHVDSPMIMDLLLKIISLERTESGQGVAEWLYTQNVMPTLISFLGPEHSWATQTSAADFIKAIITVSANASQNEQTCIGPNELTRQLVSRPCVEQLIKYMLGGGNPLTCGVGIVIEVIRKNNSDYDPEGVDINAAPSSRDPIYLGTLLRLFAEHVPDFMNLILKAPAQKQRVSSTFGAQIAPLGFDRFKTCELMAELLHCSNMMLLNEAGAEELIAARDAQRHRLRAEGRLLPVCSSEPLSANDLSTGPAHTSAADYGRKLEVMNVSADDDGFEEVSHAAAEDNSHGVLELPDAPTQAPVSALLEKDVEDFVDEPLSSPIMTSPAADGSTPGDQAPFEDPDLVVAPLSPSKRAIRTAGGEESAQGTTAGEDSAHQRGPEESESAVVGKPSPAPQADQAGPSASNQATMVLQAAPEEGPAEKGHSSADADEQPPPTEANAAPGATDASSHEGADSSGTRSDPSTAEPSKEGLLHPQPGPSAAQTAQQPENAHVALNRKVDTTDPGGDVPPEPKPVVGDFLKMQFVRHRVVPTILGFFFQYPWNNFLHNVVYDIVQQVFNGPMERGYNPTLAISLFEAADITNQIINGQRASEKSQAETKTRMGYMGHLTLIAEEVVKFTERHPPELLSELVLEKVMAQDWVNYVEGPLAETRERDNAILGGVRPEVAMSNRANAQSLMGVGFSGLGSIGLSGGASNALAEAGLNGGSDLAAEASGAGGIGPFAISAGTHMSGFGSSSDEDDDEEQETEEDVNNEFRAYTDPLNADSNSMNPPSIPPPPPPPPPLNIPPSRARLQLAARLAMNKRNAAAAAAAAAANGGEEGSSPPTADEAAGSGNINAPSTRSGERLRNPFADYDEDDDNSGSGSDDGEVENVESDILGMGSTGSAWNRGSWWRGVVRGTRHGGGRSGHHDEMDMEVERFGDGRDDNSSDEEGGRRIDDDIEDEEFGDFAMPEVGDRVGSGALASSPDAARETIVIKPMPLHPPSVSLKNTVSPFSSLWPFSREKDSGTGNSGSDTSSSNMKEEGEAMFPEASAAATSTASPGSTATGGSAGAITEEPVDLTPEEEAMISEDGKRIDRAVEAKRRTSIEDPDEDEVDVGEEIVVHRAAGVR